MNMRARPAATNGSRCRTDGIRPRRHAPHVVRPDLAENSAHSPSSLHLLPVRVPCPAPVARAIARAGGPSAHKGRPTGRTQMTKADLVEEIAATTGVSRNHTAVIIDGMLDAVCRALSEGKHLEIRGFGTFKVRERRARRARNPRSGTEVQVPAKLVPVFKPSKELKAQVLEAPASTTA